MRQHPSQVEVDIIYLYIIVLYIFIFMNFSKNKLKGTTRGEQELIESTGRKGSKF